MLHEAVQFISTTNAVTMTMTMTNIMSLDPVPKYEDQRE